MVYLKIGPNVTMFLFSLPPKAEKFPSRQSLDIVALTFCLKKKAKAPQMKQVMKGNMRGNIYV